MRNINFKKFRNLIILLLLIPGIGVYNLGKLTTLLLILLFGICTIIILVGNIYKTTYFIWLSITLLLIITSLLYNKVEVNTVFILFSCFVAGLSFFNEKEVELIYFIRILVLLLLINIIFGFFQLIFTNQFDNIFSQLLNEKSSENYHFSIGRLTSVWQEAPRLGCFMNILTPFLCYFYRKSKMKILLLILIGTIVVTFLTVSRTSILLMVIILLLYFTSKKIKLINIVSYVFILYLLFSVVSFYSYLMPDEFLRLFKSQNDYSSNETGLNRYGVYTLLLPKIPDSLVFGSGFEYKNILEPFGFSSPHNLLLQLLLVFGLPITLIILSIIIYSLKILFKSFKFNIRPILSVKFAATLSIFSIFISSLFHGLFFDLPIFLLLWTSISIALSKNEHYVKNKSINNHLHI